MVSLLRCLLVALLGANSAMSYAEYPTPYGDRADVATYIENLSQEHGFSQQALQDLFKGAHLRQDIRGVEIRIALEHVSNHAHQGTQRLSFDDVQRK